jgi:GAF domain-containing protein
MRTIQLLGGRAHHPQGEARRAAQPRFSGDRRRAFALVSDAHLEAGPRLSDLLPAVARRIADVLGDGCVIRGRAPATAPAVLHHRDPAASALLGELQVAAPGVWADAFHAQVLHTGEPVLLTTVPAELLELWTQPAFECYLRDFSLASIAVVPLRARRRLIGSLRAWRDKPDRPYTRGDLAFLGEVADRLEPHVASPPAAVSGVG